MKTDAEKFALIRDWMQWFIDNTEAFGKGKLANDIAYLVHAIATDGYLEVTERSPIVRLLVDDDRWCDKHDGLCGAHPLHVHFRFEPSPYWRKQGMKAKLASAKEAPDASLP